MCHACFPPHDLALLQQIKTLEATNRRLKTDVEAAAGEKGTLVAQEQAAKAIAKEALHGLFAAIGSLARGMVVAGNSVGEPFGQRMEAELIVEGESSALGMDPGAVLQATEWLVGGGGGREADTGTHSHTQTHTFDVCTHSHTFILHTHQPRPLSPSLSPDSLTLTHTHARLFIYRVHSLTKQPRMNRT